MSNFYSSALSIASKPKFVKRNLVVKKSSSFDYVKFRLLRPLLKFYNKLLISGYGKNKPWLCPASIEILSKGLSKEMKGLEYGSGRSTYFFAELLGKLVSIEHHPDWYQMVSRELERKGSNNVTYELINVKRIESKNEIEIRYKSPFVIENTIYSEYYLRIDSFPASHFDFILIDGRARVECSQRAIPKLKNGGIFVLDNSERIRYQPIHEMLSDWNKITTTTGLTDTTLWFKP